MFRGRRKPARALGCLGGLALIVAGLGAAWIVFAWLSDSPSPKVPGVDAVLTRLEPFDPTCASAPWHGAAEANAASLQTLAWAPWGRPETGWEAYAPLIGQEIGSSCAPGTEAFAEALSRWQAGRGQSPDGRMSPAVFEVMRIAWLRRRPFVMAMSSGCPAPAPDTALVLADPGETYGGQALKLRPAALDAYRRMVRQARADTPDLAQAPHALAIVSAFRAPDASGSDCPPGRICDKLSRANCSAHRTGLAVDLYLGAAPGADPTSTDDGNRLFQSRTPAYRWLVKNAGRFGFLPYPYEPWHWEWTGEAP